MAKEPCSAVDIMKEASRISQELANKGYVVPEIALIGAQVQMGASSLITKNFIEHNTIKEMMEGVK